MNGFFNIMKPSGMSSAAVVAVMRRDERTSNPGPDFKFAVGDVLEAIGSPQQLASLKELLGAGDGEGAAE